MSAYDEAVERLPETLVEDDTFMYFFGQLFDESLRGDQWHGVHDALEDYLWAEYELVLDDFVDWEEYGAWYDSVH